MSEKKFIKIALVLLIPSILIITLTYNQILLLVTMYLTLFVFSFRLIYIIYASKNYGFKLVKRQYESNLYVKKKFIFFYIWINIFGKLDSLYIYNNNDIKSKIESYKKYTKQIYIESCVENIFKSDPKNTEYYE